MSVYYSPVELFYSLCKKCEYCGYPNHPTAYVCQNCLSRRFVDTKPAAPVHAEGDVQSPARSSLIGEGEG